MTQNRYAQAFDSWNKAMDGQKTRKTAVTRKAPLKVQTELWDEVRVLTPNWVKLMNWPSTRISRPAAIHTTPRVSTSLSNWKKAPTNKPYSGHPGVADLREQGAIGNRQGIKIGIIKASVDRDRIVNAWQIRNAGGVCPHRRCCQHQQNNGKHNNSTQCHRGTLYLCGRNDR